MSFIEAKVKDPPVKDSDILQFAIDAAKRVDRSKFVPMSTRWFEPLYDGRCSGCFAGIVMMHLIESALDVEIDDLPILFPYDFSDTETGRMLGQIDILREEIIRYSRKRENAKEVFHFSNWQEFDEFLSCAEEYVGILRKEGR